MEFLRRSWLLSPKYILSRVKQKRYFKRNQDKPWLTAAANMILSENLNENFRVLEFGSGRSTLYFASLCDEIYSREHDLAWYEKIKIELSKYENIKYSYFDSLVEYSKVNEFEDNFFDLIIVDGRKRGACFYNSFPKLKLGGVILLDNAERYLNYDTTAPAKFLLSSRDSEWDIIEESLLKKCWQVKTSDGVTDTLFFFKREN